MLPALAKEAVALSGGCDAAVQPNAQRILAELAREEDKFASTLEAGGFPSPCCAGRWLTLKLNAWGFQGR